MTQEHRASEIGLPEALLGAIEKNHTHLNELLPLEQLPYFHHVRDAQTGQFLYLVGVQHFNSPADEQYPVVLELWEHFLKEVAATDPYSVAVICEGGVPTVVPDEPATDALKRNGEQALVAHLVHHADTDIQVLSGDPPVGDEISELLAYPDATQEVTSYYYYMRMARQYLSARAEQGQTISFDEYVRQCESIWEILDSPLLDFSLDKLQATHQALYPETPFDPTEPLPDGRFRTAQYYEDMFFGTDLPQNLTEMQLMARRRNKVSTQYKEELIDGLWGNGAAIFSAYGHLHVRTLEHCTLRLIGFFDRYGSWVGRTACRAFLRSE